MASPTIKVQFNSSTLKASYNTVTKKVIVYGCSNAITITCTNVDECNAPLNLWPSDFNDQEFEIPFYNLIGGNCYYIGDILGGDWHVTVIRQLAGADKGVSVNIWTDISYDDGENVWTEGTAFWKGWDVTPEWSDGGANNEAVCGVDDGISSIMIGENGSIVWASV